jgi:calcium-dependent protein kinase
MKKHLDHPNLLPVNEIFKDSKFLHFIMPKMFGGDLYDRINHLGTFSEHQTKKIITQILNGVSHLHSFGICHRDLKPENILFESNISLHVKIIDFGLSKLIKPTQTAVGHFNFRM